VSGGNVIDFGGASVVEWGVCWNTSGNPEINDERAYAAGETDSFTCNISELIPGKYYYYCPSRRHQNSIGMFSGNEKHCQVVEINRG